VGSCDIYPILYICLLRASPAMNPARPRQPFFHPDGGKRPSRAPGSSFPPGFGPLSIRRAQAIPGPPGRARGLRTREKRGRACSVSERTRTQTLLSGRKSTSPSPRCSVAAGTTPRQSASRLLELHRPSSHQPIFGRPACRLAIFRRRATPPVAPRRHAQQVFVYLPGWIWTWTRRRSRCSPRFLKKRW
jgi:hypothetical protein